MNTAYGDLTRSKTSDKILHDKLLTLFSLWYFDVVFAHGAGNKIIPPPPTLFLIGECYILDVLHIYLVPYVV